MLPILSNVYRSIHHHALALLARREVPLHPGLDALLGAGSEDNLTIPCGRAAGDVEAEKKPSVAVRGAVGCYRCEVLELLGCLFQRMFKMFKGGLSLRGVFSFAVAICHIIG